LSAIKLTKATRLQRKASEPGCHQGKR